MGEWLDRLTQMNQSEAALYVCGAAIVLVLLRYGLARLRKPVWPVAILLALVAVATYLSMGHDRVMSHFARQRAGTFHYYMGAKYFKELQYGGLYDYCLLADVETHNKLNVFGKRKGRYQIKQIRDLNDYSKIKAQDAVRRARENREQDFTDERWESFKRDWTLQTAYFNDDHSAAGLGKKLNDHGFNPPPFWTVIPTFVANRVDLADGPAYAWARVIDLSMLFLVCLLAAIFLGLDTGALMFIYAFTAWYYRNNFIAPFFNFMWLWTLALSLIFYQRGKMKCAGVALAYSTMLRVFPLVYLAGPLLVWLRKTVRNIGPARRAVAEQAGEEGRGRTRIFLRHLLPKGETSFLVAFVVSALLFGLIGFTQGRGVSSSVAFLKKITMHAESIKYHSNKFGLEVGMSKEFDHPTAKANKSDRPVYFEKNKKWYYLTWLLLIGLNLAAILTRIDDEAWVIALSQAFIFTLMTTSRYYYLGLLVFFIVPKDKRAGGFATLAATTILGIHFLMHYLSPLDSGRAFREGFVYGNYAIMFALMIFPAYLLTREAILRRRRRRQTPIVEEIPGEA